MGRCLSVTVEKHACFVVHRLLGNTKLGQRHCKMIYRHRLTQCVAITSKSTAFFTN